ncbi:MAG: aminotransferase class I/II-fold pyridoxal phosphate-dependent enzyme [Planctomycetales bacterium]
MLSDEIYEKLIYPGSEFCSFASLDPKLVDLTITISGVSKAYAMTGWRIGWSIAPVALTKAMDNLQSRNLQSAASANMQRSPG